ncbi:MAG: hypothetical protein KDD53_01925, partial [Bdellovibrionales bacterium]|nr:hypothetical protein [Bdellovibrionales bacterium]
AKNVTNPEQDSLGLIDITAIRNHYGPQTESFESEIYIDPLNRSLMAQFIRAPLIKVNSPEVNILASHGSDTVLVRQNNILASSFHVELGSDTALHEFFLNL